jgi:hypothetical protein
MTTLRIREGIVGGLIAGMAMAMIAMLYTFATQNDLLAPLKQMGALFVPNDSGSAISLVAGLMLHMMASAVFGVVFLLIARSLLGALWLFAAAGFVPVAIAGMAYIVVEWAIASYLILPAIDRPLLPTFASVGGFVAHLMFGAILAAWLVWRAAPVTVHVHSGAHTHNPA